MIALIILPFTVNLVLNYYQGGVGLAETLHEIEPPAHGPVAELETTGRDILFTIVGLGRPD